MFEEENAQWGLVHALVLDGKGGARSIARTELDQLQLQPQESLWLHWDRSHPQTQTWLRKSSGLSEFACDLLLEENTRPRLLALPGDELLLFLRGVNLNPGAEPEDMVSIRIFANAQQLISMRLRPMRAVKRCCTPPMPAPTTDDAAAWVVEIGAPRLVAPKIAVTAPMLAATPVLA